MSKIITMDDIRSEALDKFDIELLSTEKVPIVDKMLWRDNKTGLTFWRSWHNLRAGQITPYNPSKSLNIEDIKKEALSKYGFELLTTRYTNAVTKMKWKDIKTGRVFFRRWSSIKEGHVSPTNLNDYDKDKYKIESYKGLGYKYNQTEEQYGASPKSGNARLFTIEHPSLPEEWVTTMANFIKNAETHLLYSGTSFGELTIMSILRSNNIKFNYQYSVTINNTIHKFDFYIPDYKLFIEYDGKQHYVPVSAWGGNKALNDRKNKDRIKNEYVGSVGCNMLRVPYTKSCLEDIVQYIEQMTPLDLPHPVVQEYPPRVAEIAKYYDSHTSDETVAKFGLNRNTITRYYKSVYGDTRRNRRGLLK